MGINGTRDVLAVDASRRLIHITVTAAGTAQGDFLNTCVFKYEESAFDALPNLLIRTAFEEISGATTTVYVYVDATGQSLVFACYACVSPRSFTQLHVRPLPLSGGDPVRLLLRTQRIGADQRESLKWMQFSSLNLEQR